MKKKCNDGRFLGNFLKKSAIRLIGGICLVFAMLLASTTNAQDAIKTTPLAACDPYIAAEAASFNTSILSISALFRYDMSPV